MIKDLSVREVIKATYNKLVKEHQAKKIHFPQGIMVEIANDSDWHRTRVGYMKYSEIGVLDIGDKKWLFGMGEKAGSYPGEIYDCDLIGKRVESDLSKKRIEDKIMIGEYFRNTLILGMASGQLGVSGKDKFGGRMVKCLERDIKQEHFSQQVEFDNSHFTMDLRPVCTRVARYSPKVVDVIANAINDVFVLNP